MFIQLYYRDLTHFNVQKARHLKNIQKTLLDFNIKGKVRFRLTAMIFLVVALVSKKEYPTLDKTTSMFQVHNLKSSQKY